MAKSNPQTTDLRQRLSKLLSDWNAEITGILGTLDDLQASAAPQDGSSGHTDSHANDLEELRQRIRDRDLALDYLKKKAKEKDARIAELEREHMKSRTRAEQIEQRLKTLATRTTPESGTQQDDPQAEIEAMRAELAARKSLIKSLRADAERSTALEQKLAESRGIISKLQETIEYHTKANAKLRANPGGRERIQDATRTEASPPSELSASDALTDKGTGTIVIDMADSLRAARRIHRDRTD